jgi:hypothetical protein
MSRGIEQGDAVQTSAAPSLSYLAPPLKLSFSQMDFLID